MKEKIVFLTLKMAKNVSSTRALFNKDPLMQMSVLSNTSHHLIQSFIAPGTMLLDVGCNTGFIGKQLLHDKQVISDGIDINDVALSIAKKSYRTVYKRDLYTGKMDIKKRLYDYIIFPDVLEHLPRPDLVLQDAHSYLKKNGTVVISLPNVARIDIRLKLLFGAFDYTHAGIMSSDHLRFFTKKSAVKMIEHCGYTVEQIIPTGIGHTIKILGTLAAFQFIYVCRPVR